MAYIMNESLLGELETDEVSDDNDNNDNKEAISVSFVFCDRTLIVDRFIVQVNAFFDNLIERNIAIEYKKDTTGGIRKYSIDCKFRREYVTAEFIVKIMLILTFKHRPFLPLGTTWCHFLPQLYHTELILQYFFKKNFLLFS